MDTYRKLAKDLVKELESIKEAPIRPSQKVDLVTVAYYKAKGRLGTLDYEQVTNQASTL